MHVVCVCVCVCVCLYLITPNDSSQDTSLFLFYFNSMKTVKMHKEESYRALVSEPGSLQSMFKPSDPTLSNQLHQLVKINPLVLVLGHKIVESKDSWKITADGDCSHEIKRRLLLGRKVMINLGSIFKRRDIILPTSSV